MADMPLVPGARTFFAPMWVDTHAHLYHEQFAHDRAAMVARALAAGVTRLYLPNIDAESTAPMHALCAAYPGVCFPMMGLHPCHVAEEPETQLRQVEQALRSGGYVAVGEIGIDLYWEKKSLGQQQEVFRQQLQWAKMLNLPVAIHCRSSFAEVMAIVEEEKTADLRGVFHCFSGSVDDARRVLALDGFYLGIGGVITYPKSGLARTLSVIGAERCVLETDAPFLAPVPHRSKRNESAYVPLVAQALTEATGSTLEKIATTTTANALTLFGI
jgi:TatD DNase family protein